MSYTVDTTKYPDGKPLLLEYYAADATQSTSNPSQPGNVSAPTYTLNVDNQPVGLTLSGPATASSDAGPQTVTATATTGPSLVGGISCTLDGAPVHSTPPVTPSASEAEPIQVSGAGPHTVTCQAHNNAVDANGNPAESPVESWTLDIQQPTVSSITFARIADALRCSHRREHVRVPGRWTTERYHGRRIRVRIPAQTRTVRVVHCRPRIVTRTVTVNGKRVRERVVVLPHTVQSMRQRAPFGRATSVSGWIGTTGGNALGGVEVKILTAADNGSANPDFTPAATTTTAANGSWTAELPPGPSRLVEAVYPGTDRIAEATSPAATVTVRASVHVTIRPRSTRWNHTIQIRGQLAGGYIPASGELVVLWIGWTGGKAEIGHVYTSADGSFSAPYTFLRGSGQERYRIWAQSVRETDYPFAPGSSRPTRVLVR